MPAMVTAEDKKNLLEIGRALAETDEEFMEGLLKFQSGVSIGIVIGMARASGTDVKMETLYSRKESNTDGRTE